jgi:hypothetical protein
MPARPHRDLYSGARNRPGAAKLTEQKQAQQVEGAERPLENLGGGWFLVYVDNAFVESRGRQWCHLLADSTEELHEFAAAVGLSRQAFHRAARIPHYDITAKQRLLMLSKGVQSITVRQGIFLTRHLALPKLVAHAKPAYQQELFA